MTVDDHYKTLGITQSASENDVKKAYRTLAKQYHPDKNKGAGAEERFKEIGAAYEVLKDSSKRFKYDSEKKEEEEKKARSKPTRHTTQENVFNFAKPKASTQSSGTSTGNSTNSNYYRGFSYKTSYTFKDDFSDDSEYENFSRDRKNKHKSQAYSKGSSRSTRPPWNENFTDEHPFSFGSGHSRESSYSRLHPLLSHMGDILAAFYEDAFFTDYAGTSGLRSETPLTDPLADMWDWTKPMFTPRGRGQSSEAEDINIEVACEYCNRTMSFSNLLKHEEVCRRLHNYKRYEHSYPQAGPSPTESESHKSQPKPRNLNEDLLFNVPLYQPTQNVPPYQASGNARPAPKPKMDVPPPYVPTAGRRAAGPSGVGGGVHGTGYQSKSGNRVSMREKLENTLNLNGWQANSSGFNLNDGPDMFREPTPEKYIPNWTNVKAKRSKESLLLDRD